MFLSSYFPLPPHTSFFIGSFPPPPAPHPPYFNFPWVIEDGRASFHTILNSLLSFNVKYLLSAFYVVYPLLLSSDKYQLFYLPFYLIFPPSSLLTPSPCFPLSPLSRITFPPFLFLSLTSLPWVLENG